MNKLTKVHMQDFSFHVNNISEQACRKPVDKIVSISGFSGSDGCSGKPGSNGISGRSSSHFSKAGGNGGRGANGSNGQSGKSGTNSHHALIQLDGSVEKLKMQVKKFKTLDTFLKCSADVDWNLGNLSEDDEYSFQLRESKKIILVKAVGGDGGTGGQGGDGGRGGNGGNGGPGRNGKRGQDIHSEDNSADSGSNGEDGAPGGNGGNGGSGGNGGNGGDAGAGGHIQVRSIDPRLFMLIEVDCQAGLPGKGGEGGKSGSSGTGGVGGIGGRGGRGGQNSAHSFSAYDGSSGAQGSNGTDGSDGKSGKDGLAGDDGRIANHGSIQYIVMNMNGNVAEKGSNKYHATVIDYIIVDENKDSIYEPNSDFFITNVKWTNDGSITLPSGSILSFSSTKYISNDVDDISLLTQTTVNQTFLNSHEFRCHLNAVSIPTINRPYIQPVTITSEINLFNRLLPESQFSTTFLCQYPIQISNIEIPSFLGVDERGIITITFTNISTRPYGTCPDSVGSIEFIFSVHPLIKILPMNEKFLYQVKRDGNGYYIINERITSKSTNYISFEFSLNTDAADQLYQNLPWNVVLLLRNIPIQMHENNIQVAPSFRPNIHTDVLLVTSSQLTRAEFLIYMNLFRLFNYSSQMWDTQRYGAFHHPEVNWLNTTNLIIFLHSSSQLTFNAINSQLLLQHMNSSENAGFICMDAPELHPFDFIDIIYDEKYIYKSNVNAHVRNRLIMIPRDKRLLANEHVPFIITNEIDLNSRFGRLISAILLYQGFEKSYRIINEKWQLANCIFISDSIHLNFNQILVSLAMSIIQCEYDRHSREFLLSKRLIMEITRITKNRNNTTNDDWFYLLIQSLYEYIDSKFWKSFPWCGYTKKPKQRHKLQKIINNLCSLSTVKVQKNKEIYHEVRLLRLQRLAKLQFSTADAKENRTRSKR